MSDTHRLTVGLPVYNGANYLAVALDAILAQTYRDFTLVISDNASTDETPDIVAQYAARDARIVSLRHPTNLGAAPNYNAAYHHSAPTEYFVWVAHDDLPYPQLFEKAIHVLDGQPDASGAFARTQLIDKSGDVIGERDARPNLAAPQPHVRYADVIEQSNQMHPVFGVMRRSALERTGLHRSYTGSDRTLVAELAMLGPLIEIPEYLFAVREHRDRSVRSLASKEPNRDAWFDTAKAGKIGFPRWRRTWHFWRATALADEGFTAKLRARREFLRWLIPHGYWKQLAYDVVAAARAYAYKITGRKPRPRTRKGHRPALYDE